MRLLACWFFAVIALPSSAIATVIEYNNNRAAWFAAAGTPTTITFQGFAPFTIITNQYQSQGVTFTDGTDRIFFNNSFPNDGVGLYGALESIHISFEEPTFALAVDHPGGLMFRLYWQGELTYTSNYFLHGGSGFFAGLISDQPFDAAVILDPGDSVNIDDLYFGPPIPAPGAPAVLAVVAIAGSRRRRRH